ncbi:sugar ABC transporter permease [Spirochaetia bacterium]|nr:sugar ABC transporter permease [Spirochaetia bacterium]
MAKNPSKKRYTLFTDIFRNPFSYLLVLPGAVYSIVFGYLTLPYMIMAFQNYHYTTGLFHSPFVGLKNFEFFFRSNRAFLVTFNTIFLNVLFIVSGTIISILLALMLNEIRQKRFLKTAQSLLLFPNFLSWVIVSYIVFAFLSSEYGWLYSIIRALGGNPVSMYSSAKSWPWILMIIRLWKNAGINSVIYMAAITGIDDGLYEAARIDGASKIQEIRYITLPLLVPTVSILTLLAVGKIFYGDFQMIYSLVGDNGILLATTDVIDTFVFRALRQTGDPAGAMAVGVYQALVGFVLVYGSNRLAKRLFPEGAIF